VIEARLRLDSNLTDRIEAITRPALMVVGEEDHGTPVAASSSLGGGECKIWVDADAWPQAIKRD
jgi:fermentation-respiration switch protein FrsA (DUF1100 family)